MSHSANSLALHSLTTSSPTLPIGAACFHLTASLYFLPADLDEAPTAWRTKCGCCWSRRMKRWPTEPVAPSTPTFLLGNCDAMVPPNGKWGPITKRVLSWYEYNQARTAEIERCVTESSWRMAYGRAAPPKNVEQAKTVPLSETHDRRIGGVLGSLAVTRYIYTYFHFSSLHVI
jgi:hypothetical protein